MAASAPALAARTVVSLTFDDGDATQYSVREDLRSHGMRGTFWVNSGKIDRDPYWMTWPQVAGLAADGNEIAGHTLDHVDLTKVSPAEQRRQVCEDRQNLLDRGYAVNNFSYPFAAFDEGVKAVVRDCGYSSARAVGGIKEPPGYGCGGCPFAESLPPRDAFAIRTPGARTRLEELKGSVVHAEDNGGGWVVLVFHSFCHPPRTCPNVTDPDEFRAFLDWLEPRAGTKDTVVWTVNEAMTGGPPPPPPPPDTTPPDKPTITDKPASLTNSKSAEFAFTGPEADGKLECKLDGGDFGDCSSPKRLSDLPDGEHTFSVRQVDAAGNAGAAESYSWTVDAKAPDTTVTSAPPDFTKDTTPTLAFSPSEPGSAFECRLDAAAFSPCSSPHTTEALSDGPHRFEVRAVDSAGNVDESPASSSFTVDTKAPACRPAVAGQKLGAVARSGLRVLASCNEASSLALRLWVDARTAKRLGLSRTGRAVTVGSGSGRLARAGTTTVTAKLTAKARASFRRAHEVKVSAHLGARDGAGNDRSVSRTVTLRR